MPVNCCATRRPPGLCSGADDGTSVASTCAGVRRLGGECDSGHAVPRLDRPAAAARARQKSPSSRTRRPCPARSAVRIEATPRFLGIRTACPLTWRPPTERRPVLSAITAHRGEIRRQGVFPAGPGSTSTSRTPGTARVALASEEASPPEKYGHRSTTATSAPGRVESRPYRARPVTISSASTVRVGRPMMR
jgi:hypothetical protein